MSDTVCAFRCFGLAYLAGIVNADADSVDDEHVRSLCRGGGGKFDVSLTTVK